LIYIIEIPIHLRVRFLTMSRVAVTQTIFKVLPVGFNRKSASCKLLAPPSATANDAPVAPELFESNPVNSKNENSLTPAWA
jgi:hypothetical protein